MTDRRVPTTRTTPLEVSLPVCPVCDQVGKVVGKGKGNVWRCIGPPGAIHKATRMEMRLFREVIPELREAA